LLIFNRLFVQGTGLAICKRHPIHILPILGPRESAAQRISIMGIANKVAGMIAPVLLEALL
jgi:fucose permease